MAVDSAPNGTGVTNGTASAPNGAKIDPNNFVVMLDNYDSFTWNLYQYLCLLGANMKVIRSEEITLDELKAQYPQMTHLVISPGPGHPLKDSGVSIPAVREYAGKLPIMGVCMGLQCIYAAYGGDVDTAGEVVHGKTTAVQHDGRGLFSGLTQGILSTRYHSLAARIPTLPEDLEITSRTESGVVMGIRHKKYAIEAVQYHPESILSEEGKLMFANFLSLKSGCWADNPGFTSAESKPAAKPKVGANGLPTILQKIEKQRVVDVEKSKATPGFTPADLSALISLHVAPPLVSFYDRLVDPLQPSSSSASATPVALLAEIKRASPSKGDIADPSTPAAPAVALSYAAAGASVISVLTEPKWFKGSLDDMRAVRAALDTLPRRPAILRKDFILDPYQIDEARVYGADTVLLIVAMLDDERLALLYRHARSRGMEPLVEVNNASELERALAIGARVVGVNNRNLHDFEVDMNTTSRIADVVRARRGEAASEVVLIALSGITGRADVERYVEQGVRAVLVGESLMRASDKGAFARSLLGVDAPPARAPAAPLVKICGLKTPEAACAAADAGADFLGLIFAPKSKRRVTFDDARAIISAVRSSRAPADGEDDEAAEEADWFSFQTRRLARHPRKPLFVGVFQNAPLKEVLRAVDVLGLDIVQLHGHEPAAWARLIPVPVIKAFHVDGNSDLDPEEATALAEAARPGLHAVPLLDTKVGSGAGAVSGGAGTAFDWQIARRLSESRASPDTGLSRLPIVLAGGLDASNVKAAIEQVQPWALDVSGGVETDGAKDLDKIREFLKTVKGS